MQLRVYITALTLMLASAGLALITVEPKHYNMDRAVSPSVTPDRFRQAEYKKRAHTYSSPDTHVLRDSDIAGLHPPAQCFGECLDGLFLSLLTGQSLSDDEVTSLTADIEALRHYLLYNPQRVEDIGAVLVKASGNKAGQPGYDEALEYNSIILEDIMSLLPLSSLAQISASMMASQDTGKRSAGLLLIERAYEAVNDRQSHVDADPTAEEIEVFSALADTIHNIAYSESDPEKQLMAIDILIGENPQAATPQLVSILSQVTQNHSDPVLRGKAMRMAASIAEPDSPVFAQITDAMLSASPELHLAAVDALQNSLSRSTANSAQMKARLDEFKPYLEDLVGSQTSDGKAKVTAQNLLRIYYK